MPKFRYKAVTPGGEVVEGDMEAVNEFAVARRLQQSGHVPIRADEIRGGVSKSWLTRDLVGDPVACWRSSSLRVFQPR